MNYDPLLRHIIENMLTPEKLASVALSLAPSDTAILIVDMQDHWCNNDDSRDLAKKIDSLLPAFRKAGAAVYHVYTATYHQPEPEDAGICVTTGDGDRFVHKRMNSSFNMTGLRDRLAKDGISNVAICGVNLSACVRDTAIDSCAQHFNTVVLADLVANNKNNADLKKIEAFEDMSVKGTVFAGSAALIKALGTQP